MAHFLSRASRRAYRALPEAWKDKYRAERVRRLYDVNTRGRAAHPEIAGWFRDHGRPVSIVIPSYNDVPLLREALRSVADTCREVDYEVIIVNDFIDDDVSRELQSLASDRITVILKDERLGFAGTVNVGMREAKHDVVLLNSDIVAKPGWLQALQYGAYAVDPAIGMVSGMLVYPDGRVQYAGTYYARLLAPQWFGHLHVGAPATRPAANVAGYNRSVSGACVYITREALDTVGLLDEEYWLGFEDVDYGLRAWQRGVRCYYQPAALLIHHESASRGYSQGHRELASMRRFWRRWEDQFLTRRLPESAPIHLVIGPGSAPLWGTYIDHLATQIAGSGRLTVVHRIEDATPDEEVIAELSGLAAIVVACDWTAVDTVWLGTVNSSVPVYLMPGMEALAFPHDHSQQAAIVAGYRPEFDYIAPNRETAHRLRAEAAWDVRARVAPALPPGPLPETADRVVVVVAAAQHELDAIRAVADPRGYAVHSLSNIDAREHLVAVAALRPRAIVSFADDEAPLVPFALMSLGGVYLAPAQSRHSHEVLDGYNALLFGRDDPAAMGRSLGDVLDFDSIWSTVRANGHASAMRAASAAPHETARALAEFGEVPV